MHDASRLAVRLEGGRLVLLALTLRQRSAIIRTSAALELSASAFVRWAAAEASQGKPLELAAALAGLPLSSWLREVASAAAGASPLKGQLSKARRAVRRRKKELRASRTRERRAARSGAGASRSSTRPSARSRS